MPQEVGNPWEKVAKRRKTNAYFLNKEDKHFDHTFYSLGKTQKCIQNFPNSIVLQIMHLYPQSFIVGS